MTSLRRERVVYRMSWWLFLVLFTLGGGLTGYLVGFNQGVQSIQDAGLAAIQDEVMERTDVKSPSAAATIEQLTALGYIEGTVDDADHSGVYHHDEARSQSGLNFYSSAASPGALLIDMNGDVVHSWSAGVDQWSHATLLPDGSVIALLNDRGLMRLSVDSTVQWQWSGRAHHDLAIEPDGSMVVLTHSNRIIPEIHPTAAILSDELTFFSADGEVTDTVCLEARILDSAWRALLPSVSHRLVEDGKPLELLHSNHVEVFDGRLAARSPLYEAGNLLVSMRNINAVAILDGEDHTIEWLWGPGNLTFQHHPTLLDDGRILLFDNGTESSRVLTVDPLTNAIDWEYRADDFFTRHRGSNQRLPNGNTLITESDAGYVFEVTPDGERVWAYANPAMKESLRMAIWRMVRVDPALLTFLE